MTEAQAAEPEPHLVSDSSDGDKDCIVALFILMLLKEPVLGRILRSILLGRYPCAIGAKLRVVAPISPNMPKSQRMYNESFND